MTTTLREKVARAVCDSKRVDGHICFEYAADAAIAAVLEHALTDDAMARYWHVINGAVAEPGYTFDGYMRKAIRAALVGPDEPKVGPDT